MEQTHYQGWTNYETWLVSLWLDNERTSYEYWREEALRHQQEAPESIQVREGIWTLSEAARFHLADQIKDAITGGSPLEESSLYGDLITAALSEVNWEEIAEHCFPEGQAGEEKTGGPVIFAYTRSQALVDGVLIDVTETAREAGLRHPTALTSSVWHKYVEVPKTVPWQDESGRLWDVLWMLRHAAAKAGSASELLFQVYVQNDRHPARPVQLKAVCGPGDQGEPILTVMLPEED